jgi:hypothetical protein
VVGVVDEQDLRRRSRLEKTQTLTPPSTGVALTGKRRPADTRTSSGEASDR